MTPKDAIRAFKDSKIDHLAIGTYLIWNKRQRNSKFLKS
jgi:predicted NodU family carbamoyl transferase